MIICGLWSCVIGITIPQPPQKLLQSTQSSPAEELQPPPINGAKNYPPQSDEPSFFQRVVRWFGFGGNNEEHTRQQHQAQQQYQQYQQNQQQQLQQNQYNLKQQQYRQHIPLQQQYPQYQPIQNKEIQQRYSDESQHRYNEAVPGLAKGEQKKSGCNPCNKVPWIPMIPRNPAASYKPNEPQKYFNAPALQKPLQQYSIYNSYFPQSAATQYASSASQQHIALPTYDANIVQSTASPIHAPGGITSPEYQPPQQQLPIQQSNHHLVPIPIPNLSVTPIPPLYDAKPFVQYSNWVTHQKHLQPPSQTYGPPIADVEQQPSLRQGSYYRSPFNPSTHAPNHLHFSGADDDIEIIRSVELGEYSSSIEYPPKVEIAPVIDLSNNKQQMQAKSPSDYVNNPIIVGGGGAQSVDSFAAASSHNFSNPDENYVEEHATPSLEASDFATDIKVQKSVEINETTSTYGNTQRYSSTDNSISSSIFGNDFIYSRPSTDYRYSSTPSTFSNYDYRSPSTPNKNIGYSSTVSPHVDYDHSSTANFISSSDYRSPSSGNPNNFDSSSSNNFIGTDRYYNSNTYSITQNNMPSIIYRYATSTINFRTDYPSVSTLSPISGSNLGKPFTNNNFKNDVPKHLDDFKKDRGTPKDLLDSPIHYRKVEEDPQKSVDSVTRSSDFDRTPWIPSSPNGFFPISSPNPTIPSSSPISPVYSPSTAPSAEKRPKQIQIIIPYTTNNHPSPFVAKNVYQNFDTSSGWSHQSHQSEFHESEESKLVTQLVTQPPQRRTTKYLTKILASNLRELLKKEKNANYTPVDISKLQKNIDVWTEQEFSQIPGKASTISQAKNIPSDYFTTTPIWNTVQTEDSEQATTLEPHLYADEDYSKLSRFGSKAIEDNQIDLLPAVRESSASLKKHEPAPFMAAGKAAEQRELWNKVKVAISPITKEKVYVVTPQPYTNREQSESNNLVIGNFKSPRFLIRPTPGPAST